MSGLKVGQSAPDFTLLDQDGKPVRLYDLLHDQMVVLYFYPQDETFNCVKEACAFRDAYADFLAAGAMVVGVSADSVESHKRFEQNRKLPFRLLSDPTLQVHKQYAAEKSLLGIFRSRITYVIDRQGIVQHVFSARFEPGKHVRESLEALQIVWQVAARG